MNNSFSQLKTCPNKKRIRPGTCEEKPAQLRDLFQPGFNAPPLPVFPQSANGSGSRPCRNRLYFRVQPVFCSLPPKFSRRRTLPKAGAKFLDPKNLNAPPKTGLQNTPPHNQNQNSQTKNQNPPSKKKPFLPSLNKTLPNHPFPLPLPAPVCFSFLVFLLFPSSFFFLFLSSFLGVKISPNPPPKWSDACFLTKNKKFSPPPGSPHEPPCTTWAPARPIRR